MAVGLPLYGGDAVTLAVGGAQTAPRLVEVDKVAVELGPVDAGEFHRVAHGDTAGPAHARSVDHHAVHADNGFEPYLLGEEGDKLHHGERPDGDAVGIGRLEGSGVGGAEGLDFGGDKSMLAVGTVVGHDKEVVAYVAHLVLEEEQAFVSGTDDYVGGDAHGVGPFHLRVDWRDAHAACHEEQPHGFLFLAGGGDEFAGAPQGPHHGIDAFTLVHTAQPTSAVAHYLEYNVDAFELGVDVADGKRHPLAFVVGYDDYKLSGQSSLRHPRRSDLHQINLVAVQQLLLQNCVHILILFFFFFRNSVFVLCFSVDGWLPTVSA